MEYDYEARYMDAVIHVRAKNAYYARKKARKKFGITMRESAYLSTMRVGARRKDSLCWMCARSAASPGMQCCWEKQFAPVQGWDAVPVRMAGDVQSYYVRACPLYLEDARCAK